MSAPSELLTKLGRLAEEAGRMAQDERTRLVRELKPDGSIVTNGDRAVETWLRTELPALVPGSTVWGEEFGFSDAGPNGRWLVDPVDGTSNYAFYGPLWGVSIGLEVGGRLKLGAVMLPDLGELFLAEDGGGAYLNGEPLPQIPAGPIKPEELSAYSERVALILTDVPGKQRMSGAYVIDATFAIKQRFRAHIALHEKLYDVAACIVMAREVGADVRYVDGTPFDEAAHMFNQPIGRPWGFLPEGCGYVVPETAKP